MSAVPEPNVGFQVLPRCGGAHLSWLGLVAFQARRLSKDHEVLPEATEASIHASMTGLMLLWHEPKLFNTPLTLYKGNQRA